VADLKLILNELKQRQERSEKLQQAFNNNFIATKSASDKITRGKVNNVLLESLDLPSSRYSVALLTPFLEKQGVKKAIISGKRLYTHIRTTNEN
jgi:hypothetical protein